MKQSKTIAVIGAGAIGDFVLREAKARGYKICAIVMRAGKESPGDPPRISDVADLPTECNVVVDCAGHAGLAAHGAATLARGIPVISLSIGALADAKLEAQLAAAATKGGTRLQLVSGAIGALDALRAARVGGLSEVLYTGRKPPAGWRGSAAEETLDLGALTEAQTHFSGTARDAALRYPKNANVAAAVALSALGFDKTQTRLIADPNAPGNVHEISASGAFGTLSFSICGTALESNPRSSALAAMSAVAALEAFSAPIGF